MLILVLNLMDFIQKLLKKNGLLVKLHHSWIKSRIPVKYRETEDIDLTPIFIVGTNRSGTSMVTSLLSQHPDLEGIFPDEIKPTFKDNTAHTVGYCESNIWPWLRTPFAENISSENNFDHSISDNEDPIDLTNELKPSAMGMSVCMEIPENLIVSINR